MNKGWSLAWTKYYVDLLDDDNGPAGFIPSFVATPVPEARRGRA